MHAVVWSDYLCPWAYLGTERSRRLEALGLTITPQPFELHPEIPPGGRAMTEKGQRVYARVGRLCEEAGLPFRAPSWLPNTRPTLEAAEWVRATAPDRYLAVHDALFRAFFVDDRDIGSLDVIASVVDAIGLDGAACRNAVELGEGRAAVDASRERAYDAGVTGTPSWLVGDRLLLAGIQDPGVHERLVERFLAKTGT